MRSLITAASVPGRRAERRAVGRPDANPGRKSSVSRNFADVDADALARSGDEGPNIEVSLNDLAGMECRR